MPLKFDKKKCTGCKVCQIACSAWHEQVFNPEKARIKIRHEYEETGLKIGASTCIMCGKCEEVCPTGAIKSNGRWMEVDRSLCDGCNLCVEACPTNILFLDAMKKAVICDLCGGDPQCVKWCAKGALTLVERKVKV